MSNIFNPFAIQENLQKLGNYASKTFEGNKVISPDIPSKTKPGYRDDLNAAQQLKRLQNTRDYGFGLQGLVDDIGKAQSSFYQGILPGKTLPKVVSPAAGAALGYYASSAPASFVKNPLWNIGIRGAGAGVGALVGAAGSRNATDDEKKASQIGLDEFGATKPYRQALKGDTDQLKANAITNIGGLVKFPTSITDSISQFGGQFGKDFGKDLEKSTNKVVSGYGKLIQKGSEKGLTDLQQGKKQREEGINKLLNMAYGSGKLDLKKLPVDVLSELSPDFVKSIISGKGIDKFSIPDEITTAYSNSQTKKGATEIENHFKGKGKTPQEIQKLKEVGMASKPVASLYQSIITDPTNLVDLPIGKLKGSQATREGAALSNATVPPAQLNSGRVPLQLNAGTPRELSSTTPPQIPSQLNSGIRGELPAPKAIEKLPPETNDLGINKTKSPVKSETPIEEIKPAGGQDINQEIKPPELALTPEAPVQELKPPSTLFEEIDNFANQGNDLDTPEGLQKAEETLLATGKYTDDEVFDALMQHGKQPTPTINQPTETSLDNLPTEQLPEQTPIQSDPYEAYTSENYLNPSEDSLLKNLTANRLPGFEIPMQRDFEIPMGYYQKGQEGRDKFVPLLDPKGQKVMTKVPFEFGNKLEAEIFPYGADYLDFRRSKDPDFDINNPRLANAKKTTQQIDELYNPVARQLLAEGQDIDSLRAKLSPEGQTSMDSLLKDFTKNLYSGQSEKMNSVMTHVPNAVKKNLLTQILEKGGVAGKDSQSQAQFLRSLTPEQLKGFNLKTNTEAYKNLAPLTQRYRSQLKDLLVNEGILPANKTPMEGQPINPQQIPDTQTIDNIKTQNHDIEKEMDSFTNEFLKGNGIEAAESIPNEVPIPETVNNPTINDLPEQKIVSPEDKRIGEHYKNRYDEWQRANDSGSFLNYLTKHPPELKQNFDINDPSLFHYMDSETSMGSQAISNIPYTGYSHNDKLLLSPEKQYGFGTTKLSNSPLHNNPLYFKNSLLHEQQHGIQALSGEPQTVWELQRIIGSSTDTKLVNAAKQQLDDYVEGYRHTIGFNIKDKNQQNQLTDLYKNFSKYYTDKVHIPTELGANIASLKEIEPLLQKVGKDIYKDPNLNHMLENDPLLKNMVDIYLTRKDKSPLGEGNHFLDNIANYENELESVADSNLNTHKLSDGMTLANPYSLRPLAKYDKQNAVNPSLVDQEIKTPTTQENPTVQDQTIKDTTPPFPEKVNYMGKDFDVVGIQEDSGLPIIATPNKDGTISRLPLTQRATNQTNWNDLKKNSNNVGNSPSLMEDAGQELDVNDSNISRLSNIAKTVAAQEIPRIPYTSYLHNDKLLLNPEDQYKFGTTYIGDSPLLDNPLYKKLAIKHESQHGLQNLAGELPTVQKLKDIISTDRNKKLVGAAKQQLDDYVGGYRHTIGFNIKDKNQQNQLTDLYKNALKGYQDEAAVPRELGANIAALKEIEPILQKAGKDIYKDPNLNSVIQNQPLLKNMVDIYLTRKDKSPLGEGNHFLDNIANYETELESVAGYNLSTDQQPNLKSLAKYEGQNIAKLSSLFPDVDKSIVKPPSSKKQTKIASLVNDKQSSIIPKNFQLDLTPEEIKAYTDKPNEVQNRDYYHGSSQKLDKFLDAEKSPISTARRYGNYNYTTNNPHEAKGYGNQLYHLNIDSDRSMWNVKDFLKDNPSLLKNVSTLLKTKDIKQNEKLKPIVEEFKSSIEQANKRGDITGFYRLLKESNPEKSTIYKDLLKNLTGLDTRIVHQSSGDWALPFSGNQIKVNKVEKLNK